MTGDYDTNGAPDLLAALARSIGGDAVDRHLNNPPADVGSLDAEPRDDRPTHHYA